MNEMDTTYGRYVFYTVLCVALCITVFKLGSMIIASHNPETRCAAACGEVQEVSATTCICRETEK